MRKQGLLKRITANPRILGEKPIIRETRISVEFILELLALGATEAEIVKDSPHLTSLVSRPAWRMHAKTF